MPALSHFVSDPPNPIYAYVGAFVDELERSGLRHVVICPGSRSTPLALAFAATPGIRSWMHIDERSAGFFALGMARRLQEPVALLCTSGTAAANFLPAIAEAHLTHIPLVILTADRPHELRDCGAPQAIDQNHLYGTHVKWFVDTALPEGTNEALRYIRTIADRALAQARALPAGPVHLNMPFREPLLPAAQSTQPLPSINERDPLAWQGRPEHKPYTAVHELARTARSADVSELASSIATVERGLIIVGPQTNIALTNALLELASTTGYPILADPLSQLRGLPDPDQLILSSYDAFLRNERFCAQYHPELVLRFGAMPTSKPVLLYLKQHAEVCMQVIIDEQNGWQEPTQLAAQMLYTDALTFCRELCQTLKEATLERPTDWMQRWQTAERATRTALDSAISDFTDLFEGRVFTELAKLLPEQALIFAGNSMPIRDMDTFFWPQNKPVLALGNRGANGIDGVVSTALGASAAGNPAQPAVLVIGDLSFFHDLNGLLAARLHHLHLTIVLVNNDGGGIFSFLPQAAYPEHFEQLFGTPTGLDFRPVVEMYGGHYHNVSTWADFAQAVSTGIQADGLQVIEVPTERSSNVAMHRQLWQVVHKGLNEAGLLREGRS